MKKHTGHLIVSLILASLLSKGAWASPTNQGRAPLDRDTTYEQNLKWESSADKAITPAKVIRWMMSFRGQTLAAPSRTEFQPIVNAHDGQVRLIAAIAYKF